MSTFNNEPLPGEKIPAVEKEEPIVDDDPILDEPVDDGDKSQDEAAPPAATEEKTEDAKPAPQAGLTKDFLEMLKGQGLTIAPIQQQVQQPKEQAPDPVKALDDHYEKRIREANENMESEEAAKATREWMEKRTELTNRSIQSRLEAVEMAAQLPAFRKQYKDLGYSEEAGDEFIELQKQVPAALRSDPFVQSLMSLAAVTKANDKASKGGKAGKAAPNIPMPTVQRGAPAPKASNIRSRFDPAQLKIMEAVFGKMSDADLQEMSDRGMEF